ncbi:ABC transporter permease [Paenibacillus senegalensis]|uniref:ABC transporter permease n=1 Tax=Paenibacillus senegalensis TaxID=1465766 RepID=UPI0002881524|nr:ABC transporter permease [Paenibacillus senegalensis]
MIKLIQIEWLKMRRFCIVFPVMAAFFLLLMVGGLWFFNYREGDGGVFSIFAVQYFFLSLTLMLSITILASVTASTEHEAKGWKLLAALPAAKRNILIAKFIVVFLLMALEVLLIIAGTAVVWMLASNEAVPWDFMLRQQLYCLLAAGGFMAVQVWLSTVCSNQSIPVGFGVAGSISSLFLARSNTGMVHLLPWAYPSLSSPLIPDHRQWVVAGAVTGVIILLAGIRHFTRIEW